MMLSSGVTYATSPAIKNRKPSSQPRGVQLRFGETTEKPIRSKYYSEPWDSATPMNNLLEWLRAPLDLFRGQKIPLHNFPFIEALPSVNPDTLKESVTYLASLNRHSLTGNELKKVVAFIKKKLEQAGNVVELQAVPVNGATYQNVIASIGPKDARKVMVVGAHYDVDNTMYASEALHPGADDNASGIAALLELARLLKSIEGQLEHRIELVFYCNEEAPQFKSEGMGSAHHAKRLKENGADVLGMLNLDTIGYYEDPPFKLPKSLAWRIPNHGRYIAAVGKLANLGMIRQVQDALRQGLKHQESDLAVHSLALPMLNVRQPAFVAGLFKVQDGDHQNYQEYGWPNVMITDTGPMRNPNYHRITDRPETLNYHYMAQVVQAVGNMVAGWPAEPK